MLQIRTNAEIAKIFFLSETTVKTHLRRIFGELEGAGRPPPCR